MSKSTPHLTFAEQLEKAACDADPTQDTGPPVHPPPKRTEGLGARAALNSLGALGRVAQLVRWSQGASNLPAETPRGPRPPNTSASQPNLPSVAKAPSTPAPPNSARGRRPGSVGKIARSESMPCDTSHPHSARESSLPPVRPPTPTNSEPKSARPSVRVSYQMTPRELEAAESTDGGCDSPAPRRSGSKGPPTELVRRSAPAAPFSHSNQGFSATANIREMVEVQGNAQKLLEAVFEITITEEAAVSILDSYPELVWLANCLRRCPLPPGWTATDAGNGRLRYVDMSNSTTSDTSPLMPRFAELGRLMLHWRQNPSTESDVASALLAKKEQDLEEASRARKVWKGPHTDPKTGAEFWHCSATGRSTWGDPGMAAEFLSRIADRLHKALPSNGSDVASPGAPAPTSSAMRPRTPAKPRGSSVDPSSTTTSGSSEASDDSEVTDNRIPRSNSKTASGHPGPDRQQHRPETPHVDRQAEVRDMIAAMVSGKVPEKQKGSRPQGKQRPASPSPAAPSNVHPTPPNAPRGQRAPEQSLSEVAAELREDIRRRRRSHSTGTDALEEPPIASSRVGPRYHLTGDMSSETRRECLRKRFDIAEERLDPLDSTPVETKRPPTGCNVPLAPTAAAFEPANLLDRPLTGRKVPLPPGASIDRKGASTSQEAADTRPRSRRSAGASALGNSLRHQRPGEADVFTLSTPCSSRRPTTALGGTQGFSSTAEVGKLCAGAIAAALDWAESPRSIDLQDSFEEEDSDGPPEVETIAAARIAKPAACDDEDEFEDDDYDAVAEAAAIEAAQMKHHESADENQDVNLSMSLMSICIHRSPSPKKKRTPLSPHVESPSILVLDDDDDQLPKWTHHKPLPKPVSPEIRKKRPNTPPKSARGERPVVLGIPTPLSARARCDHNGVPLSARRRPQPDRQVASVRGA